MSRLTTIELSRRNLQFSAGHFTIFSATEREKLHGHNFQVHAALTTIIEDNGIRFDYRVYYKKLEALCRQLNLCFLLPSESSYLQITEENDYYYAHFNQEKIPFLKNDVVILPVVNVTVEELSYWFVKQLTQDGEELLKNGIQEVTVKVFSSPGRSGSSSWKL